MRNPVAALVLLLTSCGPLSAISKVADQQVAKVEACCEQRLSSGQDVELCNLAFLKHDMFVDSWIEHQRLGGHESYLRMESRLETFLEVAKEACNE